MDPTTLFHHRIQQYQSLFPDLRKYLSKNPHLTIDMVLQDIQNNPTKKHEWKFDYLCQTIPVDTLLTHNFIPERPDLITASSLINVTIDMLLRTKDSIPWCWSVLARHPDIKIADIANHPDLPWNQNIGFGIAYNPNLTHQDILDYPHLFTDNYLSMAYMNLGRKVPFEEIQNHPDKPWTDNVLANPNVKTIDQVLYLLNTFFQGINYNKYTTKMHTCYNPNLTLQDLIHLFGSNNLYYAVYNPNVTLEQLQQYPEKKWKKELHKMGHRIPLDYILEHPEIKWDWIEIMRNHKNIPYDTFPRVIPALVQYATTYGNFTPSEYHLKSMYFNVNRHLSHLDRKRLYEDILHLVLHDTRDNSRFPYDTIVQSPLFLEPTFQEIQHHFAKKKIIRLIVETLTNPSYNQCRKRLKREIQQLSNPE
jgi:hypothetical protein